MKNRIKMTIVAALVASVAASNPALAEIRKQNDTGFWVTHLEEVKAPPEDIWKRLITPKDWWNKAHSWSGSVDGFYIDPQAGGCFCELIKDGKEGENPKLAGSVEHMRVIFAQPGKVLRMTGGLGPLQSEAVTGTLTVAIAPVEGKEGMTAVSFNYLVSGFMRFDTATMAKAVDGVIGEQFAGLLKPFPKSPSGIDEGDEFTLDFEGLEEAPASPDDESDTDSGPAEETPANDKGR